MDLDSLFLQNPDVDLIIGGIQDETGQVRFHEWIEGIGWNIAEPDAWTFRDPTFTPPSFPSEWDRKLFLTFYLKEHRILTLYDVQALIVKTKETLSFDEIFARDRVLREIIANNLITPPRIAHAPLTLMTIGWLGRNYEHRYLIDALEQEGITCLRLAVDNEPNPTIHADLVLSKFKQKYRWSWKTPFPFKQIVDVWQPQAILIFQNDLPLDFAGITLPIYFFAREILWLRWPLHASVRGLFYGYYGALEMYQNTHPDCMAALRFTEFVPYAYAPAQYPFVKHEKDVFFGFMGAVGTDRRKESRMNTDYLMHHIRDLRAFYIEYAQEHCGLVLKEKSKRDEVYAQFLRRCSLVLNVPGIAGGVNQRQFHAIGCGAVLVQWYYQELEELGFQHKVNCLWFHNEVELKNVVRWAKNHPTKLEQIRAAGQELVKRKHLVSHRAQQIATAIMKDLNRP